MIFFLHACVYVQKKVLVLLGLVLQKGLYVDDSNVLWSSKTGVSWRTGLSSPSRFQDRLISVSGRKHDVM